MSKKSSALEACADALMESWFPNNHKNITWVNGEDGQQWREIALLDSKVVIEAYNNFLNEKYKD